MTHHVNHHKKAHHKPAHHDHEFLKKPWVMFIILCLGAFFVFIGIILFWVATLKLPDLDTFDERKVSESTKIYDNTGEVVLYDIHENIQRTIVSGDEISRHAKNAVVAIEDDQFYEHKGVDVRATIRSIIYTVLIKMNLKQGNVQGGSTITQQVIKNTLLTSNKQISRKLKEWFLAGKLEKRFSKDEILTQYLNVSPYGGTIYGIEEASRSFFGKKAIDLTIAESAYLAALPNAPTYFSPYGQNRDKLESRKNLVLRKMFDLGFINQEEYDAARSETVTFRPQKENSAKALHFVQYVRSYLEEKYGNDLVENGGLKVTTTLDYELQQVAEDAVNKNAEANEVEWNATNQGVIALDPKTGAILAMVGSRDYFDMESEGNFNVTLAHRQPGSSFKPFVYLTAIEKGYTAETIIFDVETQFSTSCGVFNFSSETPCYSPQNYDGKYIGPVSFRDALAQSRNVPAVKVLYLTGVENSLKTAKNMGISTLDRNADRYGLTLVLGGGEVTLLDMTSAYGVFANNGVRNDHIAVLRVEDKNGDILEEFTENSRQVVDPNATAVINSILSDNEARTPLFGARSFLYFGDSYDVAAKTGTTNNNRDAWLVGYSPNVVVGVWTGNNDNTPMKRGSSISGSTWREVMDAALRKVPREYFPEPAVDENYASLKPILRGIWQGGDAIPIDSISKKLATEYTPKETLDYIVTGTPHSILHWVDRSNPRGPIPTNPDSDSQYERWEATVRSWLQTHMPNSLSNHSGPIPTDEDDVHTPENIPDITMTELHNYSGDSDTAITLRPDINTTFPIQETRYFLNGHYIGSSTNGSFTFTPSETGAEIIGENILTITVTDSVYNRGTAEFDFELTN